MTSTYDKNRKKLKVSRQKQRGEPWWVKEDYNFLERAKAFGEAINAQPNFSPAQIAPSFFNEYENFEDLKEAYKNKTIGKEYIDNEFNKLNAAWNLLPDGGKRGVINTLQAGSEILGGTWEDLKTVEGAEKYDPTAWITSWLVHGLDFAGDKLDKYVAKPTSSFVHNQLGIDKRGADFAGLAAETLLTRRALKTVPQAINLANKGIASKQAHNLTFDAGRKAKKLIETNPFKPPSQRTISLKEFSTIIDDTYKYDIETFSKARNIYKHHPDAGWTSALTRARQLKGITNKGLIKDFTSGSLKNNSLFSQNYKPPNLMFAAENKGSEFTQRVIEGMSDEDLAPYTFKIREQPWEKSPENLLEQTTGIPQKLEQPLPYGQKYTLIPDKERGRPLRQIVKEDINLGSPKFKIGKDPIDKVVRNFRRRIIGLMQIDRIRSTDVGTKVGFNRTARNINKFTEGTSEISNTYFDYLVGYFNRFIRPGKVRNFDGAVNLIAPKVKGKEVIPNQIQTVKGNPALIRELRLYTMAPDVYGSGAFKTTDQTYQAKLKTILRKVSSVDDAGELKLWDKRRQIFRYKVDAHHVDQIAEGWVLYEGLPKEEIPKMRKLIQAYGLQPGNHSENAKLLIKQDHVRYHAKYWPEALRELETTGEGWPTLNEAARQKLLRIKTAAGREDYVQRYVKVTMESQKKVDRDVREWQTRLANKKNKTIEQLTRQEIENIYEELGIIDPSPAWDRSVKAPKDIQEDLDYEDFLNKLFPDR